MPPLATCPPDRAGERDFHRIRQLVAADQRTVVVLDDDPTGTQTVHGVAVLTEWSVPALAAELARCARCFYILTNSRALPRDVAMTVNREIAQNLLVAAAETQRGFTLISRSDSTLRGHFPDETDALADELGNPFDGVVLVPAFPEGGRVTIGGVHYLTNNDGLQPVAETEFARDATFGYRHSDLKKWVEEKTRGRVRAADVKVISLETLRCEHAALDVCAELVELPRGGIVAVDSATYADLAAFVHGLLLAEIVGRRFLARTAASFARVRAAIDPRSLLAPAELGLSSQADKAGGLIVVGSYVEKTTRQIEAMFSLANLDVTRIDTDRLFDPGTRETEIMLVATAAQTSIAAGRHALIYTSRNVSGVRGLAGELPVAESVSAALVAIMRRIQTRPRFIVAKGGITSSDLATRGLGVKRAEVLGQIAAGIPVWRLGAESRFPGLPYVVFPGNVGEANTLRAVVEMLG
jgi:uncharacterized protein YgbK (DUF1537 family)